MSTPLARLRTPCVGLLAVAVSAALLAPVPAWACAVCTTNDPPAVQRAFAIGTLLLSGLPLALIGGLIWWVRRRSREIDGAERPVAAPPPEPVARVSSALR